MENDKKSPNQVMIALIVFCTIVCIGIVIKVSGVMGTRKAAVQAQTYDQIESMTEGRREDGEQAAETVQEHTDIGQTAEDVRQFSDGEDEAETEWVQEEYSIHSYRIVVEDCSWEEAFERSLQAGGYLVRINSQEEYEYIIDELSRADVTNIHFYLGGRRDSDGTDYYWVDEQNCFMDICLNCADSWSNSSWYNNEPSYMDYGVGVNGSDVEENIMNLFCVSDRWYLNDSSDNLPENYPSLLSGKVGYLIEFK